TSTVEPSTLTSTSVFTLSARLPFAPLIVTVCPCTSALTPLASSTGFFATLDMACNSFDSGSIRVRLEHDAQPFAAVPFRARLRVRHHAARRRHDRATQTALDDRQLGGALVTEQPRTA